MKRLILGMIIVVASMIVGATAYHKFSFNDTQVVNETKPVASLGEYAMTAINLSKVKMSDATKQVMVRTIVRVADSIFENEYHKQIFVLMLWIESKFQHLDSKGNVLQSPAGARGIAQVMEPFSGEFADLAGIQKFEKTDLDNMEINMTLGAAALRALLDKFDGNPALALVAYNAGKNSLSLKQLQSLSTITHPEPVNYVAKWSYLDGKMKRALAEYASAEETQNVLGQTKEDR